MQILINIGLFIVGLALVTKGADWLTDGAASIARRYGISSMVIGLTIVAFGTSAPELIVSVLAAIQHQPEMSIGNVVGSNIFNALAIMGLTALIWPVACRKNTIYYDIPISIIASLLLMLFAFRDFIMGTSTGNVITTYEGIILLLCFGMFMVYMFATARRGRAAEKDKESEEEAKPEMSFWAAVGLFLLGLACLVLGGQWMVNGACGIAEALGVSQSVIALTIVAAGTSVPELVTSLMAAKKGDTDMAMGNVVGSNIFNILLILGVASCITPLPLGNIGLRDFVFLVGSAVLLEVFALFFDKRCKINRIEGAVLVLAAVAYYTLAVVNA